jgi:hypothetical protein
LHTQFLIEASHHQTRAEHLDAGSDDGTISTKALLDPLPLLSTITTALSSHLGHSNLQSPIPVTHFATISLGKLIL